MNHVLALDIGGTNLRVALVNDQYQLVAVDIQPTPHGNVAAFLNQVKVGIQTVLQKHAVPISAIACGVPGRVDTLEQIEILPNIGIRQVPLKSFLQDTFQCPVVIKNDAVMAAVAEGNLGFGKHLQSSYFITVSTGIGAALIVDHQIRFSSEEVGHMLVPFAGGYEELEKVASGSGIVHLAKHFGISIPDAKTFFAQYGKGDDQLKPIFNAWLDYMVKFLKWVDRYYQPEAIIFSGGVMKNKMYFWDHLQMALPHLKLAMAQFGQDAGLMGAANLALSVKPLHFN